MTETLSSRLPCPNKIAGGNSPFRQSGTAFATIDKKPSCDRSPTKGTWGGARNRADKSSWHLSRKQCLDLIDAGDFAETIGLRFNRHWSIHYAKAGIAERDAMRFIGHLLKLAGDCARRHSGQLAAIWVREGGEGKGGHVHILLHLPPGLSLKGRTRKWIGVAGGRCVRRVSRVRPVAGSVSAATHGGAYYRQNVGNVRRYLLKNVEETMGVRLGLILRGQSGLVIGKRCGWTQNIGVKARGHDSSI